jgi:biotin transport system substrate-specific component
MRMHNVAAEQTLVTRRVESLKVVLGMLILFAGSQIAIPLEPVPITFQTVAVMLIGLLYSRREALSSVILYLALGGMGLPMFQGFEGGISHLYGPTAGYLIGFIASVYVMATLREYFELQSFLGILFNCIVGTLIVFVFGLSWLAYIIGFKDAITFGLMPFIIPGAIKAFMLSGALRFIRGSKL